MESGKKKVGGGGGGVPKGWEVREIGKNYATMLNKKKKKKG